MKSLQLMVLLLVMNGNMLMGASASSIKDRAGSILQSIIPGSGFFIDPTLSYYNKQQVDGPDKTDKSGKTLLHIAAGQGNYNNAVNLIANGATIDTKDDAGNTPLHYAALKGHYRIISLLTLNNKNKDAVNSVNYNGYTPLFFAIKEIENTPSMIKTVALLLLRGADPTIGIRKNPALTPQNIVNNLLKNTSISEQNSRLDNGSLTEKARYKLMNDIVSKPENSNEKERLQVINAMFNDRQLAKELSIAVNTPSI